MRPLRFFFFSDSHLGFDYPFKARVERRRRGEDFFRNFDLVLDRAIGEKIDFLIHGGDLFYRSKIPEKLVWIVFQRLFRVADAGIPVFIVPGNHERSNIPHSLLAMHDRIHIFDAPGTQLLNIRGINAMIVGFPNDRDHIRQTFPRLLAQSGWQEHDADLRLLCMHQAVDGSRIENYTFYGREDVLNPEDIPSAFDAVLAGHIHKWQILTRNSRGEALPSPVFYSGSLERTSFIERFEEKGYFDFRFSDGKLEHEFVELPTRKMCVLNYNADHESEQAIRGRLVHDLGKLALDAVVRITIMGKRIPKEMSAKYFREIIPASMNFTLRFPEMDWNRKEKIAK